MTSIKTSKDAILRAAILVARRSGLRKVHRSTVAKAADTATGTVNYHFETMDKLRAAVVRHAVLVDNEGCLGVIAEAVVLKHPGVRAISKQLRVRALASL